MPAGERTRSRRSYSTRFHTTLCVSYTTLAQQSSNNNALRQKRVRPKAQQTWERGAGLPEVCNPGQHKAGRTCRCTPDIGNLKALKKQAPRVPKGCPSLDGRAHPQSRKERSADRTNPISPRAAQACAPKGGKRQSYTCTIRLASVSLDKSVLAAVTGRETTRHCKPQEERVGRCQEIDNPTRQTRNGTHRRGA